MRINADKQPRLIVREHHAALDCVMNHIANHPCQAKVQQLVAIGHVHSCSCYDEYVGHSKVASREALKVLMHLQLQC